MLALQKFIGLNKSNFPSKCDFKSDEDKKKHSFASCEGIVKFCHTLLVFIVLMWNFESLDRVIILGIGHGPQLGTNFHWRESLSNVFTNLFWCYIYE